MTDFPKQIAQTMLSRFGIDKAQKLQPWPFPDLSTDLLTRILHDGKSYFLKRRRIEQRGERSLFETQFIQKELFKLGIPVPKLWESPDGETLLPGPDWEQNRKVYFEIQEVAPGKSIALNEKTAHETGKFLGTFHQAASQIDTFLINKGYWIKDFTSRRYTGVSHLKENLKGTQLLSASQKQIIHEMIDRAQSFAQITARTWSLYHGDMCSNNLLKTSEGFFLIDLDEMGIGEIWGDPFSLIAEAPGINLSFIESLLKGYRQGGGTLNGADLLAIIDTLVLGRVGRAIKESDNTFNLSAFHKSLQFIKDL